MALSLGFGDKPEPGSRPIRRPHLPSPRGPTGDSDAMIEKEVRRRTMFSCLILDRMLACGKERVSTIRSEDLQIQLPCSEMACDLGEDVYTGFLKYTEPPTRQPTNDSVLARFIRLVDIWGEISKFSFAGGRFTLDKRGPWNKDTTFYQLREQLDRFCADLPVSFTLSTSNYHKHENHHASSVYVSLHMLCSVCQIMLHREYIPFIPIRCEKPKGPLDPPIPEGGPPGFWEESAEHVFKAARNIVKLIEICQTRERMPMSTLVLFSIWTAAFVGIYAWHFPNMDVNRHMLPDPADLEGQAEIMLHGPTAVTYQTLNRMAAWFRMSATYKNYFKYMDEFYDRVKNDYTRHART